MPGSGEEGGLSHSRSAEEVGGDGVQGAEAEGSGVGGV